MSLKLRYKIVTLAIVSAFLPVAVMSIMTFMQKTRLYQVLEHEINKSSIDNIKLTARDFYKTCEIVNTIIVDKVARNINLIEETLQNSGGVNIAPTATVQWDVINQISHEKTKITLPAMLIGNQPIEKNLDSRVESPIIDHLQKLTTSNYTIFQRMNEQGDMLRVATNVLDRNTGKRAVGTFIPASEPDGKKNKVIETIMAGNIYKGSAFVVDGCNITAYKPIKNSRGDIIGCIYAGVKVDAMTMVKDMIRSTRIGKSGYIAVVGGSGDNKGQYIVANDALREGSNILETKDEQGNYFIRDMVNAAIKSPGEIGSFNYYWKNTTDKYPRLKNGAFVYFAPWDWVIIPSMYLDDYSDVYNEVNDRINILLLSIVIGGIIFLMAAAMFAWYIGNRIGRPISHLSEIAGMIAHGDLCSAMQGLQNLSRAVSASGEVNEKILAKDETGQLIRSMAKMTANLNSLVGEVQKATIHLVSTSTEIAASSREQEVTVNELGASTNEIVSSTKEISSTSQQLVNTMTEVAAASSSAAELAEAGRSGLSKMGKSMEQLASATASISSKLAIINEKTSNINNVVATITKVADQTNLLSLNASIEAEKAGEYGKGFSVVAREIRRLADQTAIATLDIIKMVKEMQSAVSSGVMGMDKFSEEVRISVQETELINGQIDGIIREVQGLPIKFDMVIDGMKQQTLGAHQISDSMVQLSDCARSTSESLRAFNDAAGQLNSATMDLQKEVAIFKVK